MLGFSFIKFIVVDVVAVSGLPSNLEQQYLESPSRRILIMLAE
jgi:hypothetical protein